MEWVVAEREEEAAAASEEADGGLERKRRDKGGILENRAAAEEEKDAGGKDWSVCFDGDGGAWKCRHCIWTYQLSGPSIDHIQKHEGYCQVAMDVETLSQLGTYLDSPIKGVHSIEEVAGNKIKEANHFADANNYGLENGNAGSRINKVENQEKFPEEIPHTKNVRLENGSNSDHPSEGYIENEITCELNVEETVRVPLIKKSKIDPEIDLERVLEEQDTHDLFCPNCNSCITRRVILRKRKRTVREVHPDAPPPKLQQVQHDRDGTAALSGVTEIIHDREPDVFRCLSCFSFFIPTGMPAGRATIEQQIGESSLNMQTNPARLVEGDVSLGENQIPTGMRGTAAVTPAPRESMSIIGQGDDAAYKYQQNTTTISISGVMVHDGQVNVGQKLNDVLRKTDTGVSSTVGSNTADSADSSMKEELSSLAAAALGVAKPGEDHSSSADKDADKIHWQSFISNGEQNGDLDKNVMKSSPTKARYEGPKLHPSQIMTGDSNKAVTPAPGESMSIIGQGDDAAYIYQQNTTTISISGVMVHDGQVNVGQKLNDVLRKTDTGEDILLPISITNPTYAEGASEIIQNIHCSLPQATMVLAHGETQIDMGEQYVGDFGRKNDWEVLKSIVYGGLIESITSLSVVSSAAGSDANTLNIVAFGLANLIGGLFVIVHDLSELRSTPEQATGNDGEPVGRYWELLGRKANFRLHAIVAVLTYIVVGLLPPVIYGFSFRKSDNKEYKLIAIASASLFCIALLAIGKAHVRPQKGYIKSLAYYLVLGVSASGLSYVAGVMIHRLLEELGLYGNNEVASAPPSVMYRDIGLVLDQWASS